MSFFTHDPSAMIPALNNLSPIDALYVAFLDALAAAGFRGDIARDDSNRLALSTDNSIYQILPQAVVYPRDRDDVITLCQLAAKGTFHDIILSPRGGGTGTNGQSLCDGIMVDVSKYMNRILEINVEEKWARVEAGVVKDQLGAAIAPHGLFFAPELSTSNRATVGGMINTDASGQGSCAYGKTRDHVLELSTVFLGGELFTSSPINRDEMRSHSAKEGLVASAHRLLSDIQDAHGELIESTFPKLNRCLTGYDLAHIFTANGDFDLNSILCGSEGTLGFIVEAKLNLLEIPSHSALVNVSYTDFDASLRDAQALMAAAPTSIETIDSRVLELARGDNSWHSISPRASKPLPVLILWSTPPTATPNWRKSCADLKLKSPSYPTLPASTTPLL
jgi:FAD/FMN-containing dehydrogenase